MRLFVTGAAGQTGIATLRHLIHYPFSSKVEIYAGIHSREEEHQKKRLEPLHLDHLVPINADDPESLEKTFKEEKIDAIFIIPPSTEDKVHHGINYIRAAKRAKIQWIVLLSMIKADKKEYVWAEQFNDIEEYLKKESDKGEGRERERDRERERGEEEERPFPSTDDNPNPTTGTTNYAIIRSNFYMQNILLYKDQLREEGVLFLPTGNGKFSPIDVDDVGALAAHLLVNPGITFTPPSSSLSFIPHHHHPHPHSSSPLILTVTGRETLSGSEMAKTISKVIGKNIEFQDINEEKAKQILTRQKVPQIEIQGLLDYYKCVRNSKMDMQTKDFTTILKKEPVTFEEFIRKQKSIFHSS